MQPSASRRRPGSRATPRIGWSTNYEALDVSMLRARAVARRPLASSIANDRPPALRRRRRLVQRSLQTRESARRDPPTHPPRGGRPGTGRDPDEPRPVGRPLPLYDGTRQRALRGRRSADPASRSEEHTSELQSRFDLVCRLLLEKKKKIKQNMRNN